MHRRTASLMLVLVAAACNDPTAPPPTAMDSLLKQFPKHPTGNVYESATEEPQIPGVWNFPSPQTPEEAYCHDRLAANGDIYSIRTQTLKWDDPSGRPHPDVVRGQKTLRFRGWIGTYNGYPLQCLRLYSATFNKSLYNWPYAVAHPGTEWNISLPTFRMCYGYIQCGFFPPRIYVQVYSVWNRPYGVGGSPVYNQQILLGGTDLFGHTCTWTTELQPNGWWTVLNYGGNNGCDNGYDQWGPTGFQLWDVYVFGHPLYYQNLTGLTHWVLSG